VQAEQEREREKGGPGCDGDSTAARRQAAAGSVARTTVKGGGVGATRNGVADRWAGTRCGPGRQRLGVARGSTVRRSVRR
jgi:hypothetical protein